MANINKLTPGCQIQDTLVHLQKALSEWNDIPSGALSEIDEIRQKTRALIDKLNEQIKQFDL